MLAIDKLKVSSGEQTIIDGLDLEVAPGEVHAIMGPNGSGKSTLARVIAGDPNYQVDGGRLTYDGQELSELEIDQRARAGIFLAFQYPLEIAGLSNSVFLRTAYNAICEAQGREVLDPLDFDDLLRAKAELLKMDHGFIYRDVNSNFSGGEKKRNEVLQMAVLSPKLAILDEIDSGLDIDALKSVATGINQLRSSERAIILITHYHRILDFVVPDRLHVLVGGKIVVSGGVDLAHRVEKEGYENIANSQSG